MRALLDLMRESKAAVQDLSDQCKMLLHSASLHLKILDPEHGEEELIKSVAAELAMLSLPLRRPPTLNPQPSTLHPTPETLHPKP